MEQNESEHDHRQQVGEMSLREEKLNIQKPQISGVLLDPNHFPSDDHVKGKCYSFSITYIIESHFPGSTFKSY